MVRERYTEQTVERVPDLVVMVPDPVGGQPAYVEPQVYATWGHQVGRVIWYLFGLLEGLLTLRFVLRAIGANPDNAFAALIYAATAPFVAPFKSLVREPRSDGAAFEITTLVALFVYLLFAVAVTNLVRILSDRVST